MTPLRTNCNGLGRRDFLQTGFGALGGLAFTDLLALRAQAAQARGKSSPDQINCILVWLDGGPSHYETFDPKPDAPKEIRGEFKSIPTSVPGVHFCETLPTLAKTFDKFTVVRSICHKDPNHGGGNYYLMTCPGSAARATASRPMSPCPRSRAAAGRTSSAASTRRS